MRLVLFGSTKVARDCCKLLYNTFRESHIFVVTEKNYGTIDSNVYGYAKEKKLEIMTINDIENTKEKFDYGFSIRFHKILSKKVINKFKNGIINMHGGLLPYYRGSANHIFAILNEEEKFGVALHFIDENIDTGNLVDTREFKILDSDTGYSLLKKVNIEGKKLFNELMQTIKTDNEIDSNNQNLNIGTTYREKDLKKYQNVDLKNISNSELIKRLKAFYHPAKESIYTFINNKKVYLKLDKNEL